MAKLTHYIAIDTFRGICGTPADPRRDHASAPSCPDCMRILAAQDAEDEATARALEAEFPEWKGRLVTR